MMELRVVRASSEHADTAITQHKDTSFDPRISNVALQSNECPKGLSATLFGETLSLEQKELKVRMSLFLFCCERQGDKKLFGKCHSVNHLFHFCIFCAICVLKNKLFP